MSSRFIIHEIKESFPDEDILDEELNNTYRPKKDTQAAVWVIDPLDGTTNFSLGLPFWGVSIARLVKGRPQTGALYFPPIDELYCADEGEGAFLNDEPLKISPEMQGRPGTFFACCSRTYRQYNIQVPYKHRILGSAAYNYCSVARGIAIIAFEASPKIWDFAAGWLLIQEAGGIIETYDGSKPFPLIPGTDYTRKSYPTVAAGTPALIKQAREQIKPRT